MANCEQCEIAVKATTDNCGLCNGCYIDQLETDYRVCSQERDQLRAEVERLKEALEVYAQKYGCEAIARDQLREENARLRVVAVAARKMVNTHQHESDESLSHAVTSAMDSLAELDAFDQGKAK